MPIRVIVTGAAGKMGREVSAAVAREPGLELVGGVDVVLEADTLQVPGAPGPVPAARSVEALVAQLAAGKSPDVLVDFTVAEAAVGNVRAALKHRIAAVVGTTGISRAEIEELRDLAGQSGVGLVIASNFAIGAVLMMHFARLAAPYFDYAEIVELHHQFKADAPSGTALTTARGMAAARGRPFERTETKKETLPGTRGGALEGVTIHSVRLPGLVAHQEVILGGAGQTLTIRHDSTGRDSFMPGVLMAVKAVVERKEFIEGLEPLLGLV